MQKKGILLVVCLLWAAATGAQPSSPTYAEKVRRYVAAYKDLAMAEQVRSGVPAAITLAQGILESAAGESELATAAANHFGIKCKSSWTGETYAHDDDAPQECFRKYGSAEASYRDHSDFLVTSARYKPCFAQAPTDYAAWAGQLKTCGYATSPTYAQRLVRVIEDYGLQQYTYAALETARGTALSAHGVAGEVVPEKDAPIILAADARTALRDTPDAAAQPRPAGAVVRDGRRGFWARKGDVLLEDAIRYKIRYARLLEINGLPDEPLAADRFVYLEKAGTVVRTELLSAASHDESARLADGVSAPVATRPVVSAATVATPQEAVVEAVTPTETVQSVVEAAPAAEVATTSREEAVTTPIEPAAEPSAAAPNIAAEVAVEEAAPRAEETQTPAAPDPEPTDEMSRLKARFDRAVYATPKATPVVAKPVAETPKAAPVAASTPSSTPVFHTVRKGDTAFSIAKKYGITVRQLQEWNGLSMDAGVAVGKRLKVQP